MKKMPPREKIHEALSAIADNRITMSEGKARVASSGSEKQYIVEWAENTFTSNDSATYWQQYPGYPIIAALLLMGALPLKMELIRHFAGINWTELNKKHKRKYDKASAEAMSGICARGADTAAIDLYISEVYAALDKLDLIIRRGSRKPPS